MDMESRKQDYYRAKRAIFKAKDVSSIPGSVGYISHVH